MIFYHFTARRYVKSIMRHGLTRGRMLRTLDPIVTFIPDCQWLTTNPIFDQSWLNPESTLPYKRNEVRFTIEIPDHAMENVMPWTKAKFSVPEVAWTLNDYGDPENWWVYSGNLPAVWILTVEEIK